LIYNMPMVKYTTDEEKLNAHRASALKWARKNLVAINIKNKQRYDNNKSAINAVRRERYARKKALAVIV